MPASAQEAIATPEATQAAGSAARAQCSPASAAQSQAHQEEDEAPIQGAGSYLFLLLTVLTVVLVGIAYGNYKLMPYIYQKDAVAEIARTLHSGQNYALYDLNFDIRGVRREQFRLMMRTPEVIISGASHWQEAHAGLMPGVDFFNAHVHRDYYHDPMALVELLVRHGRLPNTLVIAVRDATFTAPADRKDNLWVPFTPESRSMEERLGLPDRPWIDDFVMQTVLDRFSLLSLMSTAHMQLKSEEVPGPTTAESSRYMDIFMADGSIRWSEEHEAVFTPEYVRERALEHAHQSMADPPEINVVAVDAFRQTLELLRDRGVAVVLAHPPYNPTYYDEIAGSSYETRLAEVEALTRKLAEVTGASVIGSFDPSRVGCTADMYIDSEHSRPVCLQKLLAQVSVSHSVSLRQEQHSAQY